MRQVIAIALAGMLVACSGAQSQAEADTGDPASAGVDAGSDQGAGGAHKVAEETADYEFAYSWPAEAGRISELAAVLDRRLSDARNEVATSAAAERQQAEANGFPFRKFSDLVNWKTVTDLPGWVSLSSETYTYTGGAHGMTTFDSLVWDKEGGRVMAPLDFFRSPSALSEATRDRFCADLDREREKKRGAPVDRSDETFGQCIDPVENSTVILGSSNGETFDRVGFLVPPYNAGPYAEGAYDVTLDLDQKMLDAVKPEYRDAFTIRR